MAKKLNAEVTSPATSDADAKTPPTKAKDKDKPKPHDGGWRETIESLAMAVILALLFKGYVAEAFVIPTGSMAPTLQGRHKDICCPQCSYWYQVSASDEVDQSSGLLTGNHVISGMCPVCRYTHTYDPYGKPNEGSFSGDRIIVSKFAYEITEPERWDVIVFKYPGAATQNYIKRLVGLPGEHLTITGGNVYVRAAGVAAESARIARKPPDKLTAMLQIVDDTDHIPPVLQKIGWPARWRDAGGAWQTDDGGRSFSCMKTEGMFWLRYRHLIPTYYDWELITLQNRLPADIHTRRGQLISDFYAYNTSVYVASPVASSTPPVGYYPQRDTSHVFFEHLPDRLINQREEMLYDPEVPGQGAPCYESSMGNHWVDDLAVECLAEIQDAEGTIALDLIRGGVHHRCTIDVKDGKATLTRTNAAGNALSFVDDANKEVPNPTATTKVIGAGQYRLRLTNCDHELQLFVNGSPVKFDQPTTYETDRIPSPQWNQADGLDLEPAGVGVSGLRAKVSQLKILRDKYYIAIDERTKYYSTDYLRDYDHGMPTGDQPLLQEIFASPDLWSSSGLFDKGNRRSVEFTLGADQFFPMGDNSPSSSDGRYWTKHSDPEKDEYLTRDLLIGKALFIYWPHSWNRPVPYQPNLKRMRPIR